VGNGVEPPHPTHSPDPEFSEEARKAKYQSVVVLGGTVNPQGTFTDLCVLRGAGAGLDEKSIDTVRTWKFEPATLQGQPVAVYISVAVSFHLY
jgi:TonB family protein